MQVDPERVVLLEDLAQLVVDPLRQEDRDAAPDPDDLDVRDLAQAAQDRFEELRCQGQAVAAGDEDIAHLRGPAQVLELGLVILPVEVLGRVADDARPRAIAAVGRALRRHEHEDAVRIAMDEAGHRGVPVLGERVLHHRREGLLLATERDDLATDRVVRILGIDQADEVRGDIDAELVVGRESLSFLIGELEDLLDLFEVVDPVRELPAPVVPLRVRDVLPERGTAADRGLPVGAEHARRIGGVDEWGLGREARHFRVGDGDLDLLGVQPSGPPAATNA